MKKIALFLMMCLPMMAMAQSNWEVPAAKTQKVAEKVEKKKTATTKVKVAKVKDTKQSNKVSVIKEADRPYLAGAVPEVDGKVVFNTDIEVPGKSAAEIYDLVYAELERLTSDEHQTGNSKIALINRDDKSIVATCSEWLVFSDKLLVLDRAEMNYVVLAKCFNGKVSVTIERITYKYDTERNPGITPAEELITDKWMLANNGTKLKKLNSKFRKGTVDRMKNIFAELKRGIK